MTEAPIIIQDNDPQKLCVLTHENVPDGIEPGVVVYAATTKDQGLQTETVDLRSYYPGLLSSPEKGTRVVTDVPSFTAEIGRYPLDELASTLWGDENKGRIDAIYNDHTSTGAGHRDNKLTLQLRPDEDWKAWHTLSGQFLPQIEFGDAIEELLHTVVEPSQADLMEVIDSIRTTSRGAFDSSVNRANGSQTLAYHDDIDAKAGKASELEIPTEVLLALRPYEGLPTYEVSAWFRFRVSNGRLALAIKLKPTRPVLRKAWADMVNGVEDSLDRPVLATNL